MSIVHGNTGSHFLDSLSAENFNLLKPSLVEVSLARDSVLCTPGSEIDAVWFPTTCVLSVVTIMLDGQDVEACTIGHEGAFGLLSALGSPIAIDRVVAQVPGAAIKTPASRLKAAAVLSLSITDLIVRHAQANAAQVQQSVACNAIHSVEQRLCRWLLMTQDRTRSDRLPLTQEFLGFMLGVQRTTVTGAARALQAAGLIRYSRGQIDILNRRGLEAGACECYASVQEKHAQLLGARGGMLLDPVRTIAFAPRASSPARERS
jgi:CRP-like cAMP-binding protein